MPRRKDSSDAAQDAEKKRFFARGAGWRLFIGFGFTRFTFARIGAGSIRWGLSSSHWGRSSIHWGRSVIRRSCRFFIAPTEISHVPAGAVQDKAALADQFLEWSGTANLALRRGGVGEFLQHFGNFTASSALIFVNRHREKTPQHQGMDIAGFIIGLRQKKSRSFVPRQETCLAGGLDNLNDLLTFTYFYLLLLTYLLLLASTDGG